MLQQVAGLKDAIRNIPALVRFEAEAALATIDGPELRYAVKLLLNTAYLARLQPKVTAKQIESSTLACSWRQHHMRRARTPVAC